MKKTLTQLSLLFCLFLVENFSATHIIGGEFFARHIADTTFEFNLIVYRDWCNGNNITDDPITISVYENGNTNLLYTFEIPFIEQEIIQMGDTCFQPDVCVEAKYYQTELGLGQNKNGYYFSWERCCRNQIVSNIDEPGDWGLVFTFSMPDPSLQNNSPEFDPYPTWGYFCNADLNNLVIGASDADGDSLVYSIDNPRTGAASIDNINPLISSPAPYMPCPWAEGYTDDNMIGGTVPLSINSETGIATVQPNTQGIFVFAVKVEEYRNGQKIGEVRREMQFETLVCPDGFSDMDNDGIPDCADESPTALLGISESDLSIYPNPTGGSIFVQSPVELDDVELFDLYGKRLRTLPIALPNWDISDLAPGTYILSIKVKDTTVRKKIVLY
ncbi:MAG: T9SS type A sorting domain-containing protein [Bacteroidota bacterium]